MSEEQQTQGEENENQEQAAAAPGKEEPKQTTQSPDVSSIAEQAAAAAVKKILDEQSTSGSAESITKEDIQSALEQQKQQIANAITGKTSESQVDPVLEEFIKNPNKVFGVLQDMGRQEMQEYVNSVIGQQQEAKTAGREVLSDRPDVINDKANQELFSLFYSQTENSKDTRSRLKEALNKYDLHMEKRGEGTVKDRISKATTISSASASSSGTPKDKKKTTSEILNEEMQQRLSRRKAQRALFT